MPSKMKYSIQKWKSDYATKGPAQHIPISRALPGRPFHFTLCFILSPLEDINLRDLPKIIPKVIPKLKLK